MEDRQQHVRKLKSQRITCWRQKSVEWNLKSKYSGSVQYFVSTLIKMKNKHQIKQSKFCKYINKIHQSHLNIWLFCCQHVVPSLTATSKKLYIYNFNIFQIIWMFISSKMKLWLSWRKASLEGWSDYRRECGSREGQVKGFMFKISHWITLSYRFLQGCQQLL